MKKFVSVLFFTFVLSLSNLFAQGVVNGKALNLVKPDYPPAAKANGAEGTVNVLVTIDEAGSVITAKAVSGHSLLRKSSEAAALASKFQPTILDGKAVKVDGVVVYNFAADSKSSRNQLRISVNSAKC